MTVEPATPLEGQFASIAYDECIRRLGWERIGRVGMVEADGTVSIYPVNYAFHNGAIIFRTTPRRAELMSRELVSFQVDRIDDVHVAGWSVLARGRLSILNESPLGIAPVSWASDGRTVTASISPTEITGREIFHVRPTGAFS